MALSRTALDVIEYSDLDAQDLAGLSEAQIGQIYDAGTMPWTWESWADYGYESEEAAASAAMVAEWDDIKAGK